MQTTDAQNIAFWPPLYLPCSGMLWSSPSTISPMRESHSLSVGVMALSFLKRRNISTKKNAMKTPM